MKKSQNSNFKNLAFVRIMRLIAKKFASIAQFAIETTNNTKSNIASIAQSVERYLGKVKVPSSILGRGLFLNKV